MTLTTVEQLQALAHPLRQVVLRLLTADARTNKQLAERIGLPPGRLHFHVRELERAGLIELVEERPKGGVVEKYYRAVASSFSLGNEVGSMVASATGVPSATFDAARQEYLRAVEHFNGPPKLTSLMHTQARLTKEQVDAITGHFEAITAVLDAAMASAGDDATPYIVTTLFHTMAPESFGPDDEP